jgi:hypothetical protein
MNSVDFTNLLEHPESIDALKTQQLDEVVAEFPYFQSARAIQLKGLKKTHSFKYNQALKKTASYTIDRKVLFEFITSQVFIDSKIEKDVSVENVDIFEADFIKTLHKKITDAVEMDTTSIGASNPQEQEIKEKAAEILEIGKPIQFISSEPHSFNEWMQLISQKPIYRKEGTLGKKIKAQKSVDNSHLIDRFIETSPKIGPLDKNLKVTDISFNSTTENESLMTETLAKVYLEQKKYENAIKAYHILSLKYPEKSGFFADRIKAIKILQKDKS